MTELEEMRARALAVQQQEKATTSTSSSYFSFSNLKIGDEIRIRFIKNPNDKGYGFWRERSARSLPFTSIKQANGEIVNNKCWVDVPAFNTSFRSSPFSVLPDEYVYKNDEDPIQNKIKGFWDMGDDGKELYNRYKRKVTNIFQGFIRSENYEPNKLYRFSFSEDLLKKVSTFLSDTGFTDSPSDIQNGTDFILRVSSKVVSNNGTTKEMKDYSNSNWARSASPLTQEELESLKVNKPFMLLDYIFKRPTVAQEKAMIEMYEASINNESYDIVRWGQYYKPNNISFDANGNVKDTKSSRKAVEVPTVQSVNYQPQVNTMAQPVAQQPQQSFQQTLSAQDIMAQLQSAQQAPAIKVSQPSAPQLINEHTETVTGQNPADVVNNLMARFGVQQPQ